MSTAKRVWIATVYWIGVVTAIACFAFVLAGNTDLLWRFEHTSFPLSWAFAGAAILAFLAAEFSNSASFVPAEHLSSHLSTESEAADF
jgi:hypothetical protein